MADVLREELLERLGQPMGSAGPSVAPDEVNLPMIRHWVDALDDQNPAYSDEKYAATGRFGQIVSPPAMLQTWTMSRPRIEGIAARGGAPGDIEADSPLAILADAGFTGTLATNSVLDFDRYLHLGDRLRASTTFADISELKATGLGQGYFFTWLTDYTDQQDAVVGRQRFTVYKFRPGPPPERPAGDRPAKAAPAPGAEPAGETLPDLDLDVTATVVVSGAIASRDFMPVHHDRDFAQAQGAPDIFMNMLTSNGYVSRFVTDWAGPEAVIRQISVRLGAPATPGHVLRFRGRATQVEGPADERQFEVSVVATNDLGHHVTGTVVVSLPTR